MITFEVCTECGDDAIHGYYSQDGALLPIPINSLAAARYFTTIASNFKGVEETAIEEARKANLPENAEGDVEVVKTFAVALASRRVVMVIRRSHG